MPADRPADADRFSPDDGPLLVDAMLGKLAVYLRMCGYDAAVVDGEAVGDDERIRRRTRREGRRLLSRNARLVASLDGAVVVREPVVADQLAELRAAGFVLTLADPPTRCGRCNGRLEAVPEGADRPDYAPPPDEFPDCWRCRACGQHFWKGSHWDRVGGALPD